MRPLARVLRALVGWPFPLGFGLDGRLLLARRGRVMFNSSSFTIIGHRDRHGAAELRPRGAPPPSPPPCGALGKCEGEGDGPTCDPEGPTQNHNTEPPNEPRALCTDRPRGKPSPQPPFLSRRRRRRRLLLLLRLLLSPPSSASAASSASASSASSSASCSSSSPPSSSSAQIASRFDRLGRGGESGGR